MRTSLNSTKAVSISFAGGCPFYSRQALLAALGHRITGIESDRRRLGLAEQLRTRLMTVWPQTGERYSLHNGTFPVLMPEPPNRRTAVFCTSLGGKPKPGLTERMSASMRRYGHMVVGLSTFAKLAEERKELHERFKAARLTDVGPVQTAPGNYCHHYIGTGGA